MVAVVVVVVGFVVVTNVCPPFVRRPIVRPRLGQNGTSVKLWTFLGVALAGSVVVALEPRVFFFFLFFFFLPFLVSMLNKWSVEVSIA